MLGGVIFGFITWLSTLSYDQGAIAMVVPIQWKPYVTKIAGIATLCLLAWNAIQQKAKNVTGGTVQQTVGGDVATAGSQTLVDQTVKASIASGDPAVTQEQKMKANS